MASALFLPLVSMASRVMQFGWSGNGLRQWPPSPPDANAHAAPAPPPPWYVQMATRMAREVTEVCVTSCPTDAMQCGRYVQTSPGVPQYAQAQGGAFTISKVRTIDGDMVRGGFTVTPYWLLDKTSSHWDLDSYVSVDAIWSQKSDAKAIRSGPQRHSQPGESTHSTRSKTVGHTDEDSVLGTYGCAGGCTTAGRSGAARWTTIAAIRYAGEPDYQLPTSIRDVLLEDINSLREECNQLQYRLNGGRTPDTHESPPPTVAEDPHAPSSAMLAWLGLGLGLVLGLGLCAARTCWLRHRQRRGSGVERQPLSAEGQGQAKQGSVNGLEEGEAVGKGGTTLPLSTARVDPTLLVVTGILKAQNSQAEEW